MCSIPGCGARPGGGRMAASWTTLCNSHRLRQRRHGDASQQPIRAAHIASYLKALKRRQAIRPDAPAWAALAGRWQGLIAACRATLAVYETGQPMSRWAVEAAGELVRVAEGATPEAVWRTAVAMWLLRETDPRLFPTEQSFKVQLGRRVRHLVETNRGRWWNPATGTFKLAFRDPSPRAAVLVGEWLVEAFGVAGEHFARMDKSEAAAKEAERRGFHEALRDLNPGATP